MRGGGGMGGGGGRAGKAGRKGGGRRWRGATLAAAAAALAVATVLGLPRFAQGIEAKCSACFAVGDELQQKIWLERPRNHLDMRHRLDKDGQRWGRVIDYRLSETRMLELTDGLCGEMAGNYTLTGEEGEEENEAFFETENWRKFRGPGRDEGLNKLLRRYETPKFMQLSRELESWCGMVLEENEEELFDAIKKQRYTERGISSVLCWEVTKYCKGRPLPPPLEGEEAEEDFEL